MEAALACLPWQYVTEEESAFILEARLDKAAFFRMLDALSGVGLDESPYAGAIFAIYCQGDAGATFDALQKCLGRVRRAAALYDALAAPALTFGSFPALLEAFAARSEGVDAASVAGDWATACGSGGLREAFDRYDTNGNGEIDRAECAAMSLVLGGCHDAFLEFALDEQLDVHGYGRALARVGLVDVSKVLSGQFVDGVWARTSGADGVGLVPFCVGVGRLLRPVAWRMEDITGWPGLAAIGRDDAASREAVGALLRTLRTGDAILSRIDDPMGSFLQFSLDSPFNHVAVVVRVDALAAAPPNEKTETLLRAFPFRRASHKFCSPGYCLCHAAAPFKFAPSALDSGGLLLLESTGEGIHVYDLAHRLFQSDATACVSCYGVRRRLGGPSDAELAPKAADFVARVRGSLYSTVRDEFKESIAFRLSDAAPPRTPKIPPREDALEHRSHFCSKVVYSFYKETGLVSDDRAAATVLPPDYTDRPDHPLASPVDFVAGVSLAPLEILWSPSAVLPKLPWKPGKPNSKPEFNA